MPFGSRRHHHATTAAPPPRRRGLFSSSRGRRAHRTARPAAVEHHHHHHHHVHTQKRKPSMKDKVSGALLKIKGSLTHRPGQKAAGTRRMHGTDGRGTRRRRFF